MLGIYVVLQHYPRVYLSKSDELESSSSVISKLVVVKEVKTLCCISSSIAYFQNDKFSYLIFSGMVTI